MLTRRDARNTMLKCSVSLKTEQSLCIQARLNGLRNSGSCMNNSIWCVGTMHAMCGQTLRMSEEGASSGMPGAQAWLWNILKLPWNSGLFSLVSGLTKLLCVSGEPGSAQHMEPLPTFPCGGPRVWTLLLLLTPQSWDWVGRGQLSTAAEGKSRVN